MLQEVALCNATISDYSHCNASGIITNSTTNSTTNSDYGDYGDYSYDYSDYDQCISRAKCPYPTFQVSLSRGDDFGSANTQASHLSNWR
jgi:hypothetical protein